MQSFHATMNDNAPLRMCFASFRCSQDVQPQISKLKKLRLLDTELIEIGAILEPPNEQGIHFEHFDFPDADCTGPQDNTFHRYLEPQKFIRNNNYGYRMFQNQLMVNGKIIKRVQPAKNVVKEFMSWLKSKRVSDEKFVIVLRSKAFVQLHAFILLLIEHKVPCKDIIYGFVPGDHLMATIRRPMLNITRESKIPTGLSQNLRSLCIIQEKTGLKKLPKLKEIIAVTEARFLAYALAKLAHDIEIYDDWSRFVLRVDHWKIEETIEVAKQIWREAGVPMDDYTGD